jgi:hypothetical protein
VTGDADPGKFLDGPRRGNSLVFLSLRFETGGHLKVPRRFLEAARSAHKQPIPATAIPSDNRKPVD